MARSIAEIKQALIDAKNAEPLLAGLSSTSAVAIWNLIFYVVAVCQWTIEKLFDAHATETDAKLKTEKTLRTPWYADMVKKFQYGDALVPDQDYYDNTGLDDAAIAARQPVKFAAAIVVGGVIKIKVAGLSGSDLAPITGSQLTALVAYVYKISGAGTFFDFTNSNPDSLSLSLRIYYDPLLLDNTGKRLDGTNDTPVQDAIDDYLKNKIDFDSYFITAALVDNLQAVSGVKLPSVISVKAKYGLYPFADVVDLYQPDAGYLRIAPTDLTLTFIPSPI